MEPLTSTVSTRPNQFVFFKCWQ